MDAKARRMGACIAVLAGGGIGLYFFVKWAVEASANTTNATSA